tara:strand:+ start:81 stop:467 length:387 start_codon:yes stop_codon:yes gene_type:complete
MSLVFTSSGSNGDNAITYSTGGSPFKPSTMAQGSMLSNAKMVYNRQGGGGKNWYDSSDVTAQRRRMAIGKNASRLGLNNGQPSSYATQNINTVRSAKQRVRSGGCVAPAKKGASPISTMSTNPVRSSA